ncbi:MAG: hypothetical protein KF850_24270 [Labilithrix sp.]|nr:hypothetical protein [Labilithrix sp.]
MSASRSVPPLGLRASTAERAPAAERAATAGRARVVVVALIAVLVAGPAACAGGQGAAVQAPVDLAIAPIASLPEAGIVIGDEPNDSGRCSLRLIAARIEMSSPGCYLDERISKGPGLLYYPCGGDGAVEADFGPQRYKGSIRNGELELELSTELDWDDGCRWGTNAVISGPLTTKHGEPTTKSLSWRYRDRVLVGTGCSGVCTARTTLQVSSTSGRTPEPPHHDDDEDDDD